ncbi:MAG: DNA repair protein RecO [Cyanobacteria bacterium J06626_4]
MSRSYKATGINLKGIPMGETDRLVTILTIEQGLVRVIVPGARKHKSRLGGRSSQFVVNELFIVQGKSLDKLVQAETIRSFPGLSADLARLTASQYLAELVLYQALSEQPQEELFGLLVAQLQQLEQAQGNDILAALTQGIVQLLIAAGWRQTSIAAASARLTLPPTRPSLIGKWGLVPCLVAWSASNRWPSCQWRRPERECPSDGTLEVTRELGRGKGDQPARPDPR